jgi:DNA-K related protein
MFTGAQQHAADQFATTLGSSGRRHIDLRVAIQLAGSLERLPNETKTELSNLFIDAGDQLAREKKHCAPYLTALGFILSRAPLYAGLETVVSPDLGIARTKRNAKFVSSSRACRRQPEF